MAGSAAPIGWGERSEPQHALRAVRTPSGFHAFTQPMCWPNAGHPSDARLGETRGVGVHCVHPNLWPAATASTDCASCDLLALIGPSASRPTARAPPPAPAPPAPRRIGTCP